MVLIRSVFIAKRLIVRFLLSIGQLIL